MFWVQNGENPFGPYFAKTQASCLHYGTENMTMGSLWDKCKKKKS